MSQLALSDVSMLARFSHWTRSGGTSGEGHMVSEWLGSCEEDPQRIAVACVYMARRQDGEETVDGLGKMKCERAGHRGSSHDELPSWTFSVLDDMSSFPSRDPWKQLQDQRITHQQNKGETKKLPRDLRHGITSSNLLLAIHLSSDLFQ